MNSKPKFSIMPVDEMQALATGGKVISKRIIKRKAPLKKAAPKNTKK